MTTARKLWGGFGLLVAILVVTGLSITLWLNGFKRELENITGVHEIVVVDAPPAGGRCAHQWRDGACREPGDAAKQDAVGGSSWSRAARGSIASTGQGTAPSPTPPALPSLATTTRVTSSARNMHDLIHSPPPNGTSLPREALLHLPPWSTIRGRTPPTRSSA